MNSAKQQLYFLRYLLLLFLIQYCDGFQSVTTQAYRLPPLFDRLSSRSLSSDRYRNLPTTFISDSRIRSKKSIALRSSPGEGVESSEPERPEWALDWMPTWLITLRPIYQVCVAVCLYILHLKVLTQKAIVFPFQLFPSSLGHFQSLGLDSLAGIISMVGYLLLRRATKDKAHPAVPPLFSSPTKVEAPWKFPKIDPLSKLPGPKSTAAIAFFLLVQGYFYVGRFSLFWEDYLYTLAGWGFKMTIPMHRSLVVLLGHCSWIALGGAILALIPRPQPFFGGGFTTDEVDIKPKDSSSASSTKKRVKRLQKFRWYTNQWNTYWLWWVMGGYFVSSWFFNLADFCNQMLLPHALFDAASDGVVAQLLNPEHNDLLAGFVGCLAPCFTAPWWEEILYRGFMLPALCLHLPYVTSVWLSGILFSIHHLSATGAIPLMILGWTWAGLYTKCGNLMVTILVHSMWNSRVFLGNWLGL